MSYKIGRPTKKKYTKRNVLQYSNKNLVQDYLKKYPVKSNQTLKITPVFFTCFNEEQSLEKKIFACVSRVKDLKLSLSNNQVLIFAYRYKHYKPLQLEEKVIQRVSLETTDFFTNSTCIDEFSLL